MKRVVIVWPGYTGYMGACWRALAESVAVKVFIEPSRYEQKFDGSDLKGLDVVRVDRPDAADWVRGEIRMFRPDLLLICGWSTPLSRVIAATDFSDVSYPPPAKVLAFDMPWECTLRKFVARLALWPRLRYFDAAFVPGAAAARYARWLGFCGRLSEGSNPSGWERFRTVKPSAYGFLFVGRYVSEKGIDVLLAAYARYRQQVDEPWLLDLVGSGDLSSVVSAHAAAGAGIRSLGFVLPEEMPRILSEHACLVLPSRWEPWGIAAAEAMSAGLMTILSDVCGLAVDVAPTRVVKPDDINGLAAALLAVHGLSEDARAAESKRVQSEMARYSAQNWARRVLSLARIVPKLERRSRKVAFLKCVDPWEEHCVECGEPACYRTCPNYRPSRTGRCSRFKDGRFLPWGKIELLWHGRMASPVWLSLLRGLNAILEPLALLLGPWGYRIFRSVRWRLGRAVARWRTPPTVWRIGCTSECDATLVASIALPDGTEVLRRELKLVGKELFGLEIPVPNVPELSLFRLSSYEGTAARVDFSTLELACEMPQSMASGNRLVKCVAWDLDGVIWRGTLSEGDELVLNEEVVRLVKTLDSQGVVSSICSKNDFDLALSKLKELGLDELFVFPQVNWGPKSESLKRLACEMNIGLDAIAFVDDRHENRMEVRANTPQVRVFAETELDVLATICRQQATTGMGAERRLSYRAEMARRMACKRDFSDDSAAFLAQSGLQVELLSVEGVRVERCRELVQRTNQLTITARRYSEAEFAKLLTTCQTAAVHVWDRYGDYGIVGFVAWTSERIVELVFSCRVACKGVERRVLDQLPRNLEVDVVKTERNAPIRMIVDEWKGSRI